jgi:hypothetical protein
LHDPGFYVSPNPFRREAVRTVGAHLLEVYLFGWCVLRWDRRAGVRTRVGEPLLLPDPVSWSPVPPWVPDIPDWKNPTTDLP